MWYVTVPLWTPTLKVIASLPKTNTFTGTGSDRRRKIHIITDGFSSHNLMPNHKARALRDFLAKASNLGTRIDAAVDEQMSLIDADLNILKNENALSDSERNPRFRIGVEQALLTARRQINRTSRLFEAAVGATGEDSQLLN